MATFAGIPSDLEHLDADRSDRYFAETVVALRRIDRVVDELSLAGGPACHRSKRMLADAAASIRAAQRDWPVIDSAPVDHSPDLQIGQLDIHRFARRAYFADIPIGLSAKEFDLLVALAANAGQVVTKAELLRDVWGYRPPPRTRTVDSHASRVRGKLIEAGAGRGSVENIWGVGYRLEPASLQGPA